jgi:hypothetical protein
VTPLEPSDPLKRASRQAGLEQQALRKLGKVTKQSLAQVLDKQEDLEDDSHLHYQISLAGFVDTPWTQSPRRLPVQHL